MTSYNLLHQKQSCFRANHSCETALTLMVDTWLSALNKGNQIGLLLIDLCKAFDLVDHDLLIKKLEIYKCDHASLQWFKSYSQVASSGTLHFRNPKLFWLFWYAEIVYFKNPRGAICGRLSILHNLTKSKMAAGYYYKFIFLLLFVIKRHVIPHFRVWNTW